MLDAWTDDENVAEPEPIERIRLGVVTLPERGAKDSLLLAVRGRIDALTPADEARLFDRGRATDAEVERTVAAILADVRARGDVALRELARRFDGVTDRKFKAPFPHESECVAGWLWSRDLDARGLSGTWLRRRHSVAPRRRREGVRDDRRARIQPIG